MLVCWRVCCCLCFGAGSGAAAGGGVLSPCGRSLAVRGHEDDRLGCHSRLLFLIGCDVPRWTSAQPASLWLPALPVRSHANTNRTVSCLRGRTAALLAPGCSLGVIWLLFSCLRGLFGGNCTASVFLIRKKHQTNHSKTLQFGANVTVRPHPAELMSGF